MCLHYEDIARQSCAMVRRWRFLRPVFLASRVQHISDISNHGSCLLCLHSLLPHLDRRLSPQGSDPLKSFLKFTLARSATPLSYNMALITTSIKSNKSSFPTTPYIQRLASLFPISIAVVPLYSACLLVCLCVCVFFVCVLSLFFF